MTRLLARTLLAFALISSQVGGLTHAASHFGANSDTKHFPGDKGKSCSVCQAFSASGAAAPSAAPPSTQLGADHVLSQGEAWSAAVTLDPSWSYARAPPRHPEL